MFIYLDDLSNNMNSNISEDFQRELERLGQQDKVAVIIQGTIDDTISVQRGCDRQEVIEHMKQSAQPIVDYLEQQGIPYKGPGELGTVPVELTVQQIYDLAKQPYVRGILNGKVPIDLIKPVHGPSEE